MKEMKKGKERLFNIFSEKTEELIGNPWSFIVVMILMITWIALGPYFNFSTNWQAILQIVSSIITLLIVFSIQNAQNRENKSFQIKLNELIRAIPPAKNDLIDLKKLTDAQLKELEQKYHDIYSKEKSQASSNNKDS